MAEAVSHGDVHATKPPPKRRRILHPSDIKPVQVYSNKVNRSLLLKPSAALLSEKDTSDDGADDSLWAEFSSRVTRASAICLSDSEDDGGPGTPGRGTLRPAARDPCCPSPCPPSSESHPETVQEGHKDPQRRQPEASGRELRPVPGDSEQEVQTSPDPPSPVLVEDQDEDDVLIVTPDPQSSVRCSGSAREIPLKIRCRTDIHKIPVLMTSPLSEVVSQLSVILDVPPPRLLLLRGDEELTTTSTVGQLGLGIADIIECVVMAAADETDGSGVITVRLQSKNRDSSQEFSVHRDAPLDSVFSRYLSSLSSSVRRKVCFQFDGSTVTGSQTPAQLDLEDGDIIEVWV